LKPEVADTDTYGFTYQPHWASGLALSVDYYDIKLADAISTLSNQVIINECYNGLTAACSLVVRNASNQITLLYNQAINLASYSTRGLDLDASYQLRLADLNGSVPGTVTVHALATRVFSTVVNDGVNPPVDRAGEVGPNDTFAVPHWNGTLLTSYSLNRLRVGAQVHFIGGGNFDNTYATGVTGKPGPNGFTINNNRIGSYTYLSLNAAYDIGASLQIYGVVNNALDKDPPAVPAGAGSTNPVLYDVIGRTFKIGARLSF
jgi:outer membrane receptor protein involved in Fe transport